MVENKDMRKIVRNIDKLRMKFGVEKLQAEEIMAEIDLRSIQAILIGMEHDKFAKFYDENDLINALEKDLCEAFLNPQPFHCISHELSSYEEP